MSIMVQLAIRAEPMRAESGVITGVRLLAGDERADLFLIQWIFGVTQRVSLFGYNDHGMTFTNGAERVFVRIEDPEDLRAIKAAVSEHRGLDYEDNELRLGAVD